MPKVRKGNVSLRIKDSEVEYYVGRGFDVIENGEVVRKATPVSIEDFRRALSNTEVELAEVKKENEELKAEIERLKSAKKPTKKTEK